MVVMDDVQDNDMVSESGSSDYEGVEDSLKRKVCKNSNSNKKLKAVDPVLPDAKPKKNTNELYKQPTAEELNRLRETENLFNSNIFRLQIDELISEVSVKSKHIKQFEKWLESFDTFVNTLPDYGDIALDDFKKITGKKLSKQQKFINSSLKDLKNPLFASADGLVMKFNKPTSAFTFGRFKYNADIKLKDHINLCLTISKNSFYEKDYLNNKYLIKRYYYLIYVLYHLKQNDEYKNVKVTFYLNNEWMPVLIITPTFSEKIKINIFVAAQDDTFKLARFLPNRNNIKQCIFNTNHFVDVNVDRFSNDGTILYNSVLLHDFTLLENNKLIEKTFLNLKNVQDGIKLLIVWLTQRHLNVGYRSFTNDILVYICLYLTCKKKINQHMSSYQVVRIFWSFLSSSDLSEEVLSICQDIKDEDLDLFRNNFDVVLVDPTGSFNVAAFLDLNIYLKTKSEATLAVHNLDNNRFNTFSALFTTKMPFAIQYDAILKINSENNFDNIYKKCLEKDKFTYLGHYYCLISNYILKYLKKGLSNRVLNIVPFLSENNETNIIFGIDLNPQHCADVIEKGPKQYEVGAEDFKKFWGPQAELRRFKDSSIYEAVYFKDAQTIQDKRLIYKTIIKFVMEEKLKLSYELHGDEMEKLLNIKNLVTPFPVGSNEEATLKIKSSHYELSRMLRDLKLPLNIIALQGVSDVFRYLASGDSMVSISYAFRLGTATVSNIIASTCQAIWEVLQKEVFPDINEANWLNIADGFNNSWNLPHCIGAIDGKHVVIEVKAPPNSGSQFFNYKGAFSIVLMALCDSQYNFIYVDIGAAGRQSDGGVLRNSKLGQRLFSKNLNIPPPVPLLEGELPVTYYIVGDEAFPLMPNLMRPYPGRYLEVNKKIFNYSYTDVFPPIATNYRWGKKISIGAEQNILIKDSSDIGMVPRLVSPIECVIQLALHSKWPKNLEALRAMKTTFYFEISKLLKEEHNLVSTIGKDYIDVFYKGLVYRMRLYHPKEVALLKKDVTNDGVTFYKDTEESLELERNLDMLPRIAGALNGIQQESPCFGPSTSLIKRWLRSQMIDDYHISDVVVNLLNASLFLSSEPFNKPTLPQIGFLRFLKFISEYDFNLQPITVNFNNDIPKDDLNEIETKFLQNRHNYSNLYIITPYDENKSVFTKTQPTIDILRRVGFLAGETYKYLLKCTEGECPLNYKPLFIPNLEGYNALIHLKPLLNPRRHQHITADKSNPIHIEEFDAETSTKSPVVGFNPVDFYLNELRKNYEEYALFFHDFYGGNVIGVLWVEKALEKVDFKISTINARKRSTSQLLLNTDALLEDFYILGNGLVKTIDTLEK